jgi:hypothetical protein
VDAVYVVADDRGNRQQIEYLVAQPAYPRVAVDINAFVVEPVHLADLASLVVAAQQEDVRRVLQLEEEQIGEGFDRIIAAVLQGLLVGRLLLEPRLLERRARLEDDDSWPTDLHFPQSGFFQNL